MSAFANKVAWVTGAGTGIGKAGALMFAREGASVALIGRRRDSSRRSLPRSRLSEEPPPSSRLTSLTVLRSERPLND
jgi:NAD(P)-dependent dehydrogenase (short-subunit alcohol dehydrogenase family)